MYCVRQGDVLIKQIKAIPAAKLQKNEGPVVLALGEATGHKHQIEDFEYRLDDSAAPEFSRMRYEYAHIVEKRRQERIAWLIDAGCLLGIFALAWLAWVVF